MMMDVRQIMMEEKGAAAVRRVGEIRIRERGKKGLSVARSMPQRSIGTVSKRT
jgi:hypothetical protein